MLIAMEAETSSDQRPVIQAREILDKIERGEDEAKFRPSRYLKT